MHALLARPTAVFGGVVLVIVALLAILAPWVAPYDPLATSFTTVRKAPSAAHWFGTDEVGRDLLSRTIWGARASLSAGVIAVTIAVGVGVPIGMLAGYVGGRVDAVIGRLTDAMLAIPFLILAIALAEDWVEAARAVGNPPARILLRHILPNILPNILPPVMVQATLAVAAAIIAEASLSCLGLGQQPPAPSWGSMLNTAQRFLTQAPWMAIFPGPAIFLTVLAFNLFGDGLRDALDPKR